MDQHIFGGVGKLGTSTDGGKPLVVVFDETHDSRAGQVEIAIMLNRLFQTCNLRHLALEGAVKEKPSPKADWFQNLPDQKTRRSVALELLDQGEVSAAEFAAMILPGFQLHPVEQQSEYSVELPPEALNAITGYMLAIAVTTLTNDPTAMAKAKALLDAKKENEARLFIINSDPWTRERYTLVTRTTPPVPISDMTTVISDLESKASEVSADVSSYTDGLKKAGTFYQTASKRSSTMAAETITLAKTDSMIAMDIGAAHTSEVVDLLKSDGGVSVAAVSPLAIYSSNEEGLLDSAAYDRKLRNESVDTAGGIGPWLDGRRKPEPVLNDEWFQTKAAILVAATRMARAAAGGGQPPFNLSRSDLCPPPYGGKPSLIDVDLTKISVTAFSQGNKTNYEVTFPVTLVGQNKTLWLKVGQVTQRSQEDKSLEEALLELLAKVKGEKGSTAGPTQGRPPTVALAIDVRGAISDNPEALKNLKVTG